MNKVKLINNEFVQAVVGDKGLRMYRASVNGRLGVPSLTKLIVKVTREQSKLTKVYALRVSDQNIIKILTRDEISTNLLELYDRNVTQINELTLQDPKIQVN